MNNQSFCLSPCHSLSEQITPAANFAAALWQLTVLWYWHWLRAISFPMHFTPLITMSVTLLLSQYQVSLKRYNKTGTRAKTKKNKKHGASIRTKSFADCCRVQCAITFWKTDVHDSFLAPEWGHSVMLTLWPLCSDAKRLNSLSARLLNLTQQ